MKGPGRGHANDTTALQWEESCLSEQTTKLSQQSKSRQQKGRHKWVAICRTNYTATDAKFVPQIRTKANNVCAVSLTTRRHRRTSTSAPSVSTPQPPIDATIRRHPTPPSTRETSTSVLPVPTTPSTPSTPPKPPQPTNLRNTAIFQDVRHQFCPPVSNFWIFQSKFHFGAKNVKRQSHSPKI